MIIIGGSSHPKLTRYLAEKISCPWLIADTKRFTDQELKVCINQDVYEQDVVIVQSTTRPANDHLMELLLLADTTKRAGCNRITAVVPYFGYSRQDRPSYAYGPISASLVARLIETSGIDKIITVDLHSKQSEGFFKIGVKNLDPTELFAHAFPVQGNYTVVSPDVGGLFRARRLALKLNTDLAILNKTRNAQGECSMSAVIGNVVGKHCIVVDDIVDTGNTLCAAGALLMESGAQAVSVCITHAVFSENCVARIQKAGFSECFITDTIDHHNVPSFMKILSTRDLIVNALQHRALGL